MLGRRQGASVKISWVVSANTPAGWSEAVVTTDLPLVVPRDALDRQVVAAVRACGWTESVLAIVLAEEQPRQPGAWNDRIDEQDSYEFFRAWLNSHYRTAFPDNILSALHSFLEGECEHGFVDAGVCDLCCVQVADGIENYAEPGAAL